MSEGLFAVTVTPGRTPPLASTTLPLIDPVVAPAPPWANAVAAVPLMSQITVRTAANPGRILRLIAPPVRELNSSFRRSTDRVVGVSRRAPESAQPRALGAVSAGHALVIVLRPHFFEHCDGVGKRSGFLHRSVRHVHGRQTLSIHEQRVGAFCDEVEDHFRIASSGRMVNSVIAER